MAKKTFVVISLFLSSAWSAPFSIILDAGHGGEDAGGQKAGFVEKNLTLELANLIQARLAGRVDLQAVLTRKDDYSLSFDERRRIVNTHLPALFLSLHFGDHSKVYFSPPTGKSVDGLLIPLEQAHEANSTQTIRWAGMLTESLKTLFPETQMGIVPLPLVSLIGIEPPAALLELAYPRSPNELPSAANAIVQAIDRFRSEGKNPVDEIPAEESTGLRQITIEPNYIRHPEGSCLIKMGQTWVLCAASVEDKVPPFLEGKGQGWVTAEYSMLPRATNTRTRREATTGRPNGRTQEIQRLIGRALRAAVDLKALGERSITIDCDVLQADGGTRTASINGGFVALAKAVQHLQKKGALTTNPIKTAVAAVSVGIKNNELLVDLDYDEDSSCDVDMNVVMLDQGRIVELQGTAEKESFTKEQSQRMIETAQKAIEEIMNDQRKCLT